MNESKYTKQKVKAAEKNSLLILNASFVESGTTEWKYDNKWDIFPKLPSTDACKWNHVSAEMCGGQRWRGRDAEIYFISNKWPIWSGQDGYLTHLFINNLLCTKRRMKQNNTSLADSGGVRKKVAFGHIEFEIKLAHFKRMGLC